MLEMKPANHALGDRQALKEIWEKYGYWFFRDVLDKDALRAMRDEYMFELKQLGLVDPDAEEPFWNGRPIENFPATFHSLHKRKVWQNFVKATPIKAFFEFMLEDELYWIPIDYYRVLQPTPGGNPDAFLGLHQDGLTNFGMEFVTCWIPLTDIDEKVGGLVLAEAQHRRGWLEKVDDEMVFSKGPPPGENWARADYRLGDVVIFSQTMPHFGAGNSSDRFRLSLDIRPVRRSTRIPVVGEIKSIDADRVVITSEQGNEVTLKLTDGTFLRAPDPNGYNPIPTNRDNVANALAAGVIVMATHNDNNEAIMLRPAMG